MIPSQIPISTQDNCSITFHYVRNATISQFALCGLDRLRGPDKQRLIHIITTVRVPAMTRDDFWQIIEISGDGKDAWKQADLIREFRFTALNDSE